MPVASSRVSWRPTLLRPMDPAAVAERPIAEEIERLVGDFKLAGSTAQPWPNVPNACCCDGGVPVVETNPCSVSCSMTFCTISSMRGARLLVVRFAHQLLQHLVRHHAAIEERIEDRIEAPASTGPRHSADPTDCWNLLDSSSPTAATPAPPCRGRRAALRCTGVAHFIAGLSQHFLRPLRPLRLLALVFEHRAQVGLARVRAPPSAPWATLRSGPSVRLIFFGARRPRARSPPTRRGRPPTHWPSPPCASSSSKSSMPAVAASNSFRGRRVHNDRQHPDRTTQSPVSGSWAVYVVEDVGHRRADEFARHGPALEFAFVLQFDLSGSAGSDAYRSLTRGATTGSAQSAARRPHSTPRSRAR